MNRIREIKAEIIESYTLDRFVQRDPYTFVSLVAKINGKDHVGHGFAKRNPIDEPDPELGQTIAVGRAVHDIALQIYQKRNGDGNCPIYDFKSLREWER